MMKPGVEFRTHTIGIDEKACIAALIGCALNFDALKGAERVDDDEEVRGGANSGHP
jgi:hypothetical protein